MLYALDDLLTECEHLHGHMCPGQVLGVRMALLGCHLIGIADPRGADRKKLIVWVEIDRCLTDAISAVTSVRLGKRSLKYFDYGKVAATFFNVETKAAIRIVALEESRLLADKRYPLMESKKERQMSTYRNAAEDELFKTEQVTVAYTESDAPGSPRSRIRCEKCGEGINDGREIVATDNSKVCRPCANGGYYTSKKGSRE